MRWACDFETYPNAEKTWVWAWGAANIDNPEEFVYDSKISDFFSGQKNKTLFISIILNLTADLSATTSLKIIGNMSTTNQRNQNNLAP